jgi:uncharacterized membrane protein
MNNWKIIGRIATIFGILGVIFAVIAALLNYEINVYLYSRLVPAGFIQVSAVNAMLPFLLVAMLSFAAAAIISAYGREKPADILVPVETQLSDPN